MQPSGAEQSKCHGWQETDASYTKLQRREESVDPHGCFLSQMFVKC
jgi:hypothetical protein